MASDTSESKRPTWSELKEQAPGLCEAVVAWIRCNGTFSAAPASDVAMLLTGQIAESLVDMSDELGAIRLRAAEYRMEAAVADAIADELVEEIKALPAAERELMVRLTMGIEQTHRSVAMRQSKLADALDAACSEAERLAGGGT